MNYLTNTRLHCHVLVVLRPIHTEHLSQFRLIIIQSV